jgi:hypothetical protein
VRNQGGAAVCGQAPECAFHFAKRRIELAYCDRPIRLRQIFQSHGGADILAPASMSPYFGDLGVLCVLRPTIHRDLPIGRRRALAFRYVSAVNEAPDLTGQRRGSTARPDRYLFITCRGKDAKRRHLTQSVI